MTYDEMEAAIAGMSQEQQASWIMENRDALLEMTVRMSDPDSLEHQIMVNRSRRRELEWCQSHTDPDIQPGDLRFRRRRVSGKNEWVNVPLVVVKVHKLEDGRRFYDVLHDGAIFPYEAEILEKLPSELQEET
jgi:hypothetical protein